MIIQVLIPHGACQTVKAMQCVVNMERRRCLVRRAGESTEVQEATGFHVGGLYCSEKLRGSGRATALMLRLLGAPQDDDDARQKLPFAKVYDQNETYLPHV